MKILFLSFIVLVAFTARDACAHLDDDPTLLMMELHRLESRGGGDGSMDFSAWVGRDINKFWLSVEGDKSKDEREFEYQLGYERAISPFWNMQAGLRRDCRDGDERDWLSIGLEGLLPYFIDSSAQVFVAEDGRYALRLKGQYDLLLSQRLVLTPDAELNVYSRRDDNWGQDTGLSDVEFGLRLRYEIKREIAPYVGVVWSRSSVDGVPSKNSENWRVALGLHMWY